MNDTTSAAFVCSMRLRPQFIPLLVGIVGVVALLAVSVLFVVQLSALEEQRKDAAAVRAEVRTIVTIALARRSARLEAIAAQARAESDQAVAKAVTEIRARMRALGAPLWEDQATILQQMLAAHAYGLEDAPSFPDNVLAESGPVFSPRQRQILSLVRAEFRWAEAMQGPRNTETAAEFSVR